MSCLDETTLWDLVEGRLSGPDLRSADEHVDSCELCRSAVVALTQTDAEPAALPERGEAIGRFVVLDPLGRGAMGVVYAAYDPDLDRRVAIKIVRPDSFGGAIDGRERALREAQAMARLDHPNVVRVYEVGPHRSGIYVAMELVEGASLRVWLAEKRATHEIVRVLVEAGRGLAAAHERGVIHQDFKPDNVVVSPDGHAKVADFGLARAEAAHEPRDGALGDPTRTAGLRGTPAYMAPELAGGRRADARSDQFAFAVTAFEALYGRRPFDGATRAELDDSIARGLRELPRASIGKRIERAIARALSPDRTARFESMAALLRELDPPKRSRLAAWLAASAIVAVAVGGFTVAAMDEESEPCGGTDERIAEIWSPAIAAEVEAAFERARPGFGTQTARASAAALDAWLAELSAARATTCRATHVTRDQSAAVFDLESACLDRRLDEAGRLIASFRRADDRTVIAAADAVADLPPVAECTDAQNLLGIAPRPTDPAALAELRALEPDVAQGRVDLALGEIDRGRIAALIERARRADFAPIAGEVELVAAAFEGRASSFESAEEHARRALFAFEEGRDASGVARAWLALVAVAGDRGDYNEAKALAEHARAAVERAGSPAGLASILHHELGIVATNLGAYDEAGRDLSRALELRIGSFGDDHVEVSRVRTSLGNLARSRGDLAEAIDQHQRALAADERVLGPRHPTIARHLHNIGGVLRLQHQLAAARERYERALAIRVEALGPDHTDVAYTNNSLGLVCAELGDRACARTRYEEALRIFALHRHADEALVQKNLGLVDLDERRPSEALARFERARAIWEDSVGRVHRRTADAMLSAAVAHRELGNGPRANELFDEVQAIAVALEDGELAERARAERVVEPPTRAPERTIVAPAPRVESRPDPPTAMVEPRPATPMVCVNCSSATGYGPAQAWDDP